MTDLDTITAFNPIIEILKDGERSFRAAAEEAYHAELKARLNEYAQDCARGAVELQQAVMSLGGKPEEIGSTGGTVRRGWMHLKALALGRDESVILEECERFADSAELRYQHALGVAMPAAMGEIVQRQYARLQQHHDELRSMRNQYAHA